MSYSPPPPPAPPALQRTSWWRTPTALFLIGILIAAAIAVPIVFLVLGGDDEPTAGSTTTTRATTTTGGGSSTTATTSTTAPIDDLVEHLVDHEQLHDVVDLVDHLVHHVVHHHHHVRGPGAGLQPPGQLRGVRPGQRVPARPVGEHGAVGRSVDTSYLGGGCLGWASQAPDFEVNYTAASSSLRFYFVADTVGDDTTLIISDPTGNWVCGDDSYGTRNPTVDFTGTAPDGVYDIWIGSYSAGAGVTGTFYVTELDANHP